MRAARLDQSEACGLVLAVKFEPAVFELARRVVLDVPRQRVTVLIDGLAGIEIVELDRLRVCQTDPHAIAEGVEREGVERVVVVCHAPAIERIGGMLCASHHTDFPAVCSGKEIVGCIKRR